MREFGPQQVHNIMRNPEHYKADPENQKTINHVRTLKRVSLVKLDLAHCKRYLEWILHLPEHVIMITIDETPHEFGGSHEGRYSIPSGDYDY